MYWETLYSPRTRLMSSHTMFLIQLYFVEILNTPALLDLPERMVFYLLFTKNKTTEISAKSSSFT
jgi:hypothetical protein